MEFLTTSELADKLKITRRCVSKLCSEGRIKGSVLKNTWLIPSDAKKPEDPRRLKQGGQQK
jgi:DNA-binding transcriptional regulator LsrR (DeoR family)